jgi:hypothetical protein
MVPHLDADVAPPHLVRDSGRGPRTEKGVENEVTGVGVELKKSLYQGFGFLPTVERDAAFVVNIVR